MSRTERQVGTGAKKFFNVPVAVMHPDPQTDALRALLMDEPR